MTVPRLSVLILALLVSAPGLIASGGLNASRKTNRGALAPAPQSTLAGGWVLRQTGDKLEIEFANGALRAAVNGVEWRLRQTAESYSGTKILTADDARLLFPEIGDATSFLSGNQVQLDLTFAPDSSSATLSLTARVPGAGAGKWRNVELLSGPLLRAVSGQADELKPSNESGTQIRPQVVGTPTITVKGSVAPNLFGSPSFAQYTSNALAALGSGLSMDGNPATSPAGYAQTGQAGDRSNIPSSFKSWLGMTNPGTVFGAAFANEVGNRVHFGFHILGNGTQFKLNNIAFHLHGTDAGDNFALDGNFIGANYSSTRMGINYGPDRIKGTPDDVVITSGPGTQLVDELVYVGVGNAIAPPDIACTGTSQAMLDCVKARYDQLIPFSLTATYDLFDDSEVTLLASGSGTVNFGSCLTITCPANIVAKALAGQSTAAVTFPTPAATDTCGEPVQVVCVPASGSQFPVGVTTVTCTATDASGSTATCTFTVEVGNAVLQDAHSGDCLLFDTKTGDYVFTHCGPGGFTLTGKGVVRSIGSTIALTDSKPDRSVTAMFLSNQLTGRATITVQITPGVSQTFTINSTKPNPSCVCAS